MIKVIERTQANKVFEEDTLLYFTIEPHYEPVYKIQPLDNNIYQYQRFLERSERCSSVYYNISSLIYLQEEIKEPIYLNHPLYDKITDFVNNNLPFYANNLLESRGYEKIRKLFAYEHYPISRISFINTIDDKFIYMRYKPFGEFVLYNNILYYFDETIHLSEEDGIYIAEILTL